MRVLILGIDGYLGWSLAQYLSDKEYIIGGVDTFYRRDQVEEIESYSAIPISNIIERMQAYKEIYGKDIFFRAVDVCNYDHIKNVIQKFKPDCIVHLAENPSAPYSMIDALTASWVQFNNIIGTLNILHCMKDIVPDCHLLKLGTMGEYGTPEVNIPEGFFDYTDSKGKSATLPFPKSAGSFYHLSKVHDSENIRFACKNWDLRSTDIMQGIVYGNKIASSILDKRLSTRLDFDEYFGTVINRFCCQAVINHPLTLYGKGLQKRGFLTLSDSMQCLKLSIDNPPVKGEYRVFNQIESTYRLIDISEGVIQAAESLGIQVTVQNINNPRKELESHSYAVEHLRLKELGFKPENNMKYTITELLFELKNQAFRISNKKSVIEPKTKWV
jgi:UDP-sulfoquinovose synthase